MLNVNIAKILHDIVIILTGVIVTTLIIFASFYANKGAQHPNAGHNIQCVCAY